MILIKKYKNYSNNNSAYFKDNRLCIFSSMKVCLLPTFPQIPHTHEVKTDDASIKTSKLLLFFFTFSKPCSLSNPSALQIDFHKVSVCGNTCLLKVTSLKAFSTLPLIPTPNNLFCCHISDPISVLFSHLSFSLMMIGFTRMLLCRISVSFSWLLCRLCCTQSMAMLLELPFGGFFFPSHEFLPFNLFSLSLCFFICSLAPF